MPALLSLVVNSLFTDLYNSDSFAVILTGDVLACVSALRECPFYGHVLCLNPPPNNLHLVSSRGCDRDLPLVLFHIGFALVLN